MPSRPNRDIADASLVKPGDVVWLDARHLTPTRGTGGHAWPHYAICLFCYDPATGTVPNVIVAGTVFQFACISSLTRNNPLDPATQVRLDHDDPNLGLNRPSAACVDFAADVKVTVEGTRHVLDGVRRLTVPVTWRVPASPTLQAINSLFARYWTQRARGGADQPARE